MDDNEKNGREEIFSKAIRAGKRTYFFDVKATRGNDFYLTVTESKKRFLEDGKFRFEKHKLFLYKEDFEKFTDGLTEAIDTIQELRAENPEKEPVPAAEIKRNLEEVVPDKKFTNVNFEDLDK